METNQHKGNTMKRNVLLVDDDRNNNLVVRELLEPQYTVMVTENGKEAIQLLGAFVPDIILLDWDMPVMDGLATLRELKSNIFTRNIPVIMVTGYMTDNDNLLLAYNEGVIDFIRKPFDEMELLARINSILHLSLINKELIAQKEHELFQSIARTVELKEFTEKLLQQVKAIENINEIEHCREKLSDLIANFNVPTSDSLWTQFENNFINIVPDFYKNLLHKHPDLSPAEIKLAAMLRLNISSKEISFITHNSSDSIKVARSRLRKKLNIAEGISLVSYLHLF